MAQWPPLNTPLFQHAIISSDRLSIVSNRQLATLIFRLTAPETLKPYLDSEYSSSSWRPKRSRKTSNLSESNRSCSTNSFTVPIPSALTELQEARYLARLEIGEIYKLIYCAIYLKQDGRNLDSKKHEIYSFKTFLT